MSKRKNSADGKSRRIEFSKHFRPTELKPGDVIELGGLNVFDGQGYSFTEVMIGTDLHLICTERDVAIVREAA